MFYLKLEKGNIDSLRSAGSETFPFQGLVSNVEKTYYFKYSSDNYKSHFREDLLFIARQDSKSRYSFFYGSGTAIYSIFLCSVIKKNSGAPDEICV